ncbi:hypothetical protein JCM8547_006094 [Rhodosporidiobolus lusitaniae]
MDILSFVFAERYKGSLGVLLLDKRFYRLGLAPLFASWRISYDEDDEEEDEDEGDERRVSSMLAVIVRHPHCHPLVRDVVYSTTNERVMKFDSLMLSIFSNLWSLKVEINDEDGDNWELPFAFTKTLSASSLPAYQPDPPWLFHPPELYDAIPWSSLTCLIITLGVDDEDLVHPIQYFVESLRRAVFPNEGNQLSDVLPLRRLEIRGTILDKFDASKYENLAHVPTPDDFLKLFSILTWTDMVHLTLSIDSNVFVPPDLPVLPFVLQLKLNCEDASFDQPLVLVGLHHHLPLFPSLLSLTISGGDFSPSIASTERLLSHPSSPDFLLRHSALFTLTTFPRASSVTCFRWVTGEETYVWSRSNRDEDFKAERFMPF